MDSLPPFSSSSLLLLPSGLGRSYNVEPEELRASVSGGIFAGAEGMKEETER